jgi:hypothetical protein
MSSNTRPMEEIITKVELSAEIARIALRCPTCRKDVRRLLIQNKNCNHNHNHPEGGPSTDANRLTEEIDNAIIGREII